MVCSTTKKPVEFNMSYEVSGKIVAIYPTVQRTETFRTREFAIELSEERDGRIFTNYVKFQCVQDRTTILDKVKEGDKVKVQFNLKGTKWEKNGQTNYITNLDAWRIEQVLESGQPEQPSSISGTTFMPEVEPPAEDDLPF
jgi:hypothetical protein